MYLRTHLRTFNHCIMDRNQTIQSYFSILSPDFPEFIRPYLELPLLKRLSGIGLFCGTDWTTLYQNKFFYSRLDHSIGAALIVWNFTKDKRQTLAALLHDVSTPAFSHVMDFRNGDALTQESTEDENKKMVEENKELCQLLLADGILPEEVSDYHIYPIADNDLPRLASDRLEYMFTTGMIMRDIWTLDRIEACYRDLTIMKNEDGIDELGFSSESLAVEYCIKCCQTGLIMVRNENKLALSLLAHLAEIAIRENLLNETDIHTKSETEIMKIFDQIRTEEFRIPYQTFRNMTEIIRSEQALPNCYSISLEVKRRYIDPLCNGIRISCINEEAKQAINDVLTFQDSPYASVKYVG